MLTDLSGFSLTMPCCVFHVPRPRAERHSFAEMHTVPTSCYHSVQTLNGDTPTLSFPYEDLLRLFHQFT